MALKQRKMSCALQYCSSSDNTNGYLVITNPKFTPDIYQLDSIDCGERVLMRGLALDIFNQRFVLKIFLAAAHMYYASACNLFQLKTKEGNSEEKINNKQI